MHSMASTPVRPAHGAGLPNAPRAGTIQDIEPEDAHQRLGTLLGRIVSEADARIPTGRRAPRTLAQMRARINITAGQACGSCSGAGGKTVDTSGDGVSRQHWESCTACSGTGVAR